MTQVPANALHLASRFRSYLQCDCVSPLPLGKQAKKYFLKNNKNLTKKMMQMTTELQETKGTQR